jgi:hypothetical protein
MVEVRFDQNISNRPESQNKFQLFVIENAIMDDSGLKDSLTRYCQAHYGDIPYGVNRGEVSDEEQIRYRSYVLRKVINWLSPSGDPQSLIELGSAGDISAAIALPNTQVLSVDEDPTMFSFNIIRSLPKNFFPLVGEKKPSEVQSFVQTFFSKYRQRNAEFVKKIIPNLTTFAHDAHNLPIGDNIYSMALVQGTPDMLDFLPEASRVITRGGFVVSMVDDMYHKSGLPSAYDSHEYAGWQEFSFVSDEVVQKNGMRRIDIPVMLRSYEDVGHWINRKGEEYSAGFVFEIFQKL